MQGGPYINHVAACHTSNREWAQTVKGGGKRGSSTERTPFTLCPPIPARLCATG